MDCSGLVRKPMAPELSARWRESSVDTTQIGMCRVARSPLSRSRMRQPSMSGRKMSSVITEGWYSRVIASAAAPCTARRVVALRQVQREGAAFRRCADEAYLAAQQARQLAADGQAQARAAVLARRRSVGLLEGFEDDLLLVGRDADASVRHREGQHLA